MACQHQRKSDDFEELCNKIYALTTVQYIWYCTVVSAYISLTFQSQCNMIYTLAFLFDLRCQSGTYQLKQYIITVLLCLYSSGSKSLWVYLAYRCMLPLYAIPWMYWQRKNDCQMTISKLFWVLYNTNFWQEKILANLANHLRFAKI